MDNSVKCAATFDVSDVKAKEVFLATPDREVVVFAPGEREKMDKLLAPMWDQWVTDREAEGLPGREALNDLYAILVDLGVERPFVGYTPR